MNFTHAIARAPSARFANGLTTAGLGPPDVSLAVRQHEAYVSALAACGVAVTVLPPVPGFPDAVFVEDTAVITARAAIIANPGAPTRNGEALLMRAELAARFSHLETIRPPGTLDGGDVLQVGDCFFVGVSARTNANGARQFIDAVTALGYRAVAVPLTAMLHLKTGVAWLGDDVLLVTGELADHDAFAGFDRIMVPDVEAYAANSLRINGTVLMPEGFPRTAAAAARRGYPVHTLDMSEFRKMDGGLSCLSLRFCGNNNCKSD